MTLVLFPTLVDSVGVEDLVHGFMDHERGVQGLRPIQDDLVRWAPDPVRQPIPMPVIAPRARRDEPLHLGIGAPQT